MNLFLRVILLSVLWLSLGASTLAQSRKAKVTILTPKNGAAFSESAVVQVKVRSTLPSESVRVVLFYLGNQMAGRDRKRPYEKTLNQLAPGTYFVKVALVTNRGRKYNSKTIQFSIQSPGDLPTPGLGDGASLNGRRPFPDDNPWNQDISQLPVDPNSDNLISSIGASTGLHPDFGTVWEGAPIGIPYVVVSGSQPKIKITSFWYPEESDQVGYPIPQNPPIEGGTNGTGDRHILMIDRDNWMLYELYAASADGRGGWEAGSGAVFNLNSNELRPAGWTSADAAGLPIFPGLVRYDEVYEQGEIRHALRFTVARTRRAYVYPARHFASTNTSANLPPMGMRVRLKANFDVTPFPSPVQVVLKALKKYGMMVADNGGNWFVTGAPDSRWKDEELSPIRNVRGSDFEVVQMEEIITE